MANFDVFNGDADGICALHQLRLSNPLEASLVTGPKRDIALLGRVPAQPGDAVTVLDLSMDVNRAALLALLERGVSIRYFDHHGSGVVPAHPALDAVIDTAPDVCTGIIVDRWLGGAHRPWAIVAAFGDNLVHSACQLADTLGLPATRIKALEDLGRCLNYNAYGDSEEDLFIHPAALYENVHRRADPFAFIESEPVLKTLHEGRRRDLDLALQVDAHVSLPHARVVLLPDAAWSRRVRGAYANLLAGRFPEQAHAILTPNAQGGYVVSVRAPVRAMHGADRICGLFPGGGGRPAAAGINHLPMDQIQEFTGVFVDYFRMHQGNGSSGG
jgi:hypothetical protein